MRDFAISDLHTDFKENRLVVERLRHTPIEKLTDAFNAILAGAQGLCEVNRRVRADAALQRSFGRSSCAEQSVRETLDRCSAENVRQRVWTELTSDVDAANPPLA